MIFFSSSRSFQFVISSASLFFLVFVSQYIYILYIAFSHCITFHLDYLRSKEAPLYVLFRPRKTFKVSDLWIRKILQTILQAPFAFIVHSAQHVPLNDCMCLQVESTEYEPTMLLSSIICPFPPPR